MIGGGAGAVSRYWLSLTAASLFGTSFPYGTLIVNLIGCFLIGFTVALAERNLFVGPSFRLFFVTGYLGGLTTFSTFALESVGALRAAAYPLAVANLLFNNVIGFVLVLAGIRLASLF